MDDYSLVDLICLHLNRINDVDTKEEPFSYELSTPGIAEKMEMGTETMAGRVDLLSTLSEMSEKRLVEQRTAYVEGLEGERNVYFLTDDGRKHARNVRESLESKEIVIRTTDDQTTVNLDEIDEYIDDDVEDPAVTALARADGDVLVLEDEYEMGTREMFVNREDELEYLHRLFKRVLEDQPQTVFVSGEPGVGKTTLVRKLNETVTDHGGKFLYGRCDSEVTEPYQPFVAAFADLDDELSNVLTETSGVEAEDRDKLDAQRRGMFDEVADELGSIAEGTPIVLFVDDLQWIDEPTALLLASLSRKIENGQFLLVGACRPETSTGDWPLTKALEELDEEDYDWLEIDRLGPESTAELIRRVVGNLNVPDHVIELLYEETDGNPLFVTESVTHMLDRRDIVPKLGIYPESPDEISVPDEVEETIASRFGVLDNDAQSLLELGSLIGDTIPLDVLEETSDLDEADFLDYVSALVDTGVWRYGERDETLYFGSSVVRTTVAENIDDEKREYLHQEIADSYRELRDETEDAATIAYHERKARNSMKALDYYQEAGEHAKDVYAHEAAIDAYKQAIELGRKLDKEGRTMDVAKDLGDIYHVLDEYDNAISHYEFVREKTGITERKQRMYRKEASVHDSMGEYGKLFEKVDEGLELVDEEGASEVETARLHSLWGWGMSIQGEPDEALERYERALEIVEEADDSNEEKNDARAHVLNAMGTAYQSKGEIDRAIEIFEDLVETLRKSDDKQRLAAVLLNYGTVLGRAGEYERSVEVYEESRELYEEIGDREGIISVLNNLGITYQYLDKNKKAIECFEDGLEIARATESKRALALLYVNLGYEYVNIAQFDGAVEYARKARELGDEMGDTTTIVCTCEIRALEKLHRGRFDEGFEVANEGLEIARDADAKNRIAGTLSIIGELYLKRGDYDDAIEAFEEGMEESLEYGNEQKGIINRSGLVRALIEAGQVGEAEEHIEELEDAKGIIEYVVPALSKYYRAVGDYGAAERHIENAFDELADATKPIAKAEMNLERARLYAAQDEFEKARKHAENAGEAASENGVAVLVEEAESFLEGIEED